MLNLSKIVRLEFNSGFLRYILSLFYHEGKSYSIPFGHFKGLKICYDKTINFHAMMGLWERDNFNLMNVMMKNLVSTKKEVIIYDIGANIGMFSLFFSKFKASKKIVAFEAVPETVDKLNNNLVINSIRNVSVVQKAVSDSDAGVSFFVGHHHKSSLVKDWASDRGISKIQEITVPSVRLDSFVLQNPDLVPDFIKIDVEGGGDKVIDGMMGIMKNNRPVLLFESHMPNEDQAIINLLANFNYKAYRVNNGRWVTNPKANYTDPEGVWGTMLLIPQEVRMDL